MELAAKTEYTAEIINEAAKLYWKKVFSSTFLVSICCVAISSFCIFYLNWNDWIWGSFLVISVASSVLFSLGFFIYRNRSMSIFNELEVPVVNWKFSEENISTESDIGKSEFRWSLLKGIIKSKSIWLLVFKNNSYSVFPLATVSNEVLNFLIKKIEDNNGKIT